MHFIYVRLRRYSGMRKLAKLLTPLAAPILHSSVRYSKKMVTQNLEDCPFNPLLYTFQLFAAPKVCGHEKIRQLIQFLPAHRSQIWSQNIFETVLLSAVPFVKKSLLNIGNKAFLYMYSCRNYKFNILYHMGHTYLDYQSVCPIVRMGTPPHFLYRKRVCPPPEPNGGGGGTHASRGGGEES
jgi:hypothetical protein